MNNVNVLDRIQSDRIEEYKGKWTICYTLDNGSCIYDDEKFKNEVECNVEIENQRQSAIAANKRFECLRLRNTKTQEEFISSFNCKRTKENIRVRYPKIPHSTSAFPMPIN